MTFQLQAFKSRGIRLEGAGRAHELGLLQFSIAAANTDTALDISSYVTGSLGTFWTAVIADATYGSLGSAALAAVQLIQPMIDQLVALGGEALELYQQVLSGASGNQYVTTISNHLPTITWVSGSAPTSYQLYIEFKAKSGQEVPTFDLGA